MPGCHRPRRTRKNRRVDLFAVCSFTAIRDPDGRDTDGRVTDRRDVTGRVASAGNGRIAWHAVVIGAVSIPAVGEFADSIRAAPDFAVSIGAVPDFADSIPAVVIAGDRQVRGGVKIAR